MNLQRALDAYLERNNYGDLDVPVKRLNEVYVAAGSNLTPKVMMELSSYVGNDNLENGIFNDTYLNLLKAYLNSDPNMVSITITRSALDELDALGLEWTLND